MAPKIGTLAHAQDPAWLIALWLAIHGGDPAPIEGVVAQEIQEGAALRAIAALSEALDQTSRDAVQHAIAPAQKQRQIKTVDAKVSTQRLQDIGIHVTESAGEQVHAAAITDLARTLRYCFRFRGVVYCVEFPRPLFQVKA